MQLLKYKIIALILTILVTPLFVFAELYDEGPTEASIDVRVGLVVEGENCNYNSICEEGLGENTTTCPFDCPAVIEPETPTIIDATTGSGGIKSSSGRSPILGADEIKIHNLIELNTFSDINLLFETNIETVASVRIGKTNDYELTSSIENSFRTTHFFLFSNLDSNTKYFYEITLVDKNYTFTTFTGEIYTKTFLDSVIEPTIRLLPPTNLKTITTNKIVALTWKNPPSKEFDYIRIMRTKDKETNSPLFGELIYEGRSNLINDINVKFGNEYFYTLFAKYKDGKYSDGVSINATVEEVDIFEKEKDVHETKYGNEEFSIFDFSFTQNEKSLEWNNDLIILQSLDPIIIRLKKKDLFGPIEDVFIEIIFYDEKGNYSYKNIYKLDYRPEIASYETIIYELKAVQLANFVAYIINFNQNIKNISGSIKILQDTSIEQSNQYKKDILKNTYPWPYILLFAFISILSWIIKKLIKL